MPGDEQRKQGTVNRIARPAVGRSFKVVANLGTFFTGANKCQQFLANGVSVSLLVVPHGFEGFQTSLACFVEHFVPFVTISHIKLVE